MTTGATTLLGLALPVQGELDGTWGDTVNASLTNLLDTAIAGATTLSTDADVTLTDTQLASNQARQAIILWTATGSTTRYITAPARSKVYLVINATGGSQSIVIRGAGPTTGVTVPAGAKYLVVWNGSDFVFAGGSTPGSNTQVLYNNSGVPGASSNLTFDGSNLQIGNQGDLRLGDADNSNYVAIQSPATVTVNWTITLPAADGTSGQFLVTNASGALSFTNTLTTPTINGGYTEQYYAVTTSGSTTISLANGSVQVFTLNGNITFTFPSVTNGASFMLFVKQDATGSRTVTWPGSIYWPNGTTPVQTPTANKMDKYVFTAAAGVWTGSVAGQNY